MSGREPRIAVVGTGANGGSIGADLVRAGLNPTFLEQWPEHVDVMRERGLRVNVDGRTEVTFPEVHHLCDVATLHSQFDVIFLLVKAYDTRWATELLAPLVRPDGVVVGVQNGMTHHDIASIVGAERSLGAVIEVGSAMYEPGLIERHTPREKSWFAVGAVTDTGRAKARFVAEVLSCAGDVAVVDDIHSAKWMKLVVNAGELVPSAVVNMSMKAAVETPQLRQVMRATALEAVDAALFDGASLVPIFGMDDLDVLNPGHLVDQLLDKVVDHFALPHTVTTVLQDWTKGRRSEVLEINGHVVRVLAARGRTAPCNDAAVDFALRIESGELHMSVDNLEPFVEACASGAPR